MKLCIVTHSIVKGDGQGRVNYEVALEALNRGHNLILLATTIAPELQHNSLVNWIPIAVKTLPTKLLQNQLFAWHSFQWLRKYQHQLDLIIVNGAITWAKSDVNAAHFIHSSWLKSPFHTSRIRGGIYGFYHWLYTAFNAWWEKRSFSQAKTVVAVSTQVQKDLQKIGIDRNKIRTIPNGVDPQEFFPGLVERQQFDLPKEVIMGFFAGDLSTPRKNLDTVLQSLVRVPELHLAVAGNLKGSIYPQLAKSLGIEERVHFLGQRNDVPELMRAMDLLVFPSRYETFGLVVIEAMASGLPVITTRSTGACDLVTPECGIVLSESEDVDSLTQALMNLTSNSEIRTQMSKAARHQAESHTWRQVAKSYVDLFEELG